MARDYYAILGVEPDESPEGIRTAFRMLARKYHPDRAGPESTERFREIRQAYEILADPVQRRRYDEGLSGARGVSIPIHSARRTTAPVEPLIPEPVWSRGEPAEVRPPYGVRWERLRRDPFAAWSLRDSAEPLAFEVLDVDPSPSPVLSLWVWLRRF